MILGLLTLGLVLLGIPGLVSRAPRGFPVREWAPVATISLALGALSLITGLWLAAVPAVAKVVGAPEAIDRCRSALSPLADGPTALSWVAAALGAVTVVRFVRGAWLASVLARRARIEPWLGHHSRARGCDLVVLPTPELVAYGAPGAPPQIVISEGLVDELDDDAIGAVITHEAAHHRLRHTAFLVFFAGLDRAFGVLPFARRSVDALRAALEAWADDEVNATKDREALRDALRSVVMARASVDTGRHSAIRDRLQRLHEHHRPRHAALRWCAYAPVALAGVTVLVLVGGWLTGAHHAVALDHCHH